jgi:hypothetical protein
MMQAPLTMQGHIMYVQSRTIKRRTLMNRRGYENARPKRKNFGVVVVGLKLNIVFVLIAAGIIGIQQGQAKEPISVAQLEELGIQTKTAEKKLHNLKVCSDLWVEKNNNPKDPCAVWQQTPIYVSSTMWSDGRPGGRIRVDVHKQVLEGWMTNEKRGPYSERSFGDSFDGATGRSIVKTNGFLGKVVPAKEGVITTKKPQSLDSSWSRQYTGREFTMNFFQLNSQGTLLSDLFSLAEDPNSTVMTYFEFNWEKLMGIECIEISTKETKTRNWGKRWWLDPARGFAMLRYEHVRILEDKTETFRKLIEIQELREVAEGIWWPIRATSITEPLRSGEPYTRMKYQASDVVANDPNFDGSIFTVPFPKGYLVDDKVAGKKYRVGEDPNAPK